jgi:hypothetical protein
LAHEGGMPFISKPEKMSELRVKIQGGECHELL